jgi:hypothetical protein
LWLLIEHFMLVAAPDQRSCVHNWTKSPYNPQLDAQAHKSAIEKLAAIMRTGKTEQAQVRAAEALLDRGWGRAAQQVGGIEGAEQIRVYLKRYVLTDDGVEEAVDEPEVLIR